MRVEVVFETPEIALVEIDDKPCKKPEDDPRGIPYALEKDDKASFPRPFPLDLVKTLEQSYKYDPKTETLVSWISLLRLASAQEKRTKTKGSRLASARRIQWACEQLLLSIFANERGTSCRLMWYDHWLPRNWATS